VGRREELLALATVLEGTTPAPGAEVDRARALWTTALHLGFLGERERERVFAALAAETHDDRVGGTRHMYEALRANGTGDAARYKQEFELAQVAFARSGDHRRACNTLVNVGFARSLLGDYAGAEPMLREALEGATRMGIEGVQTAALHNLGMTLWRAGRLDEARSVEEQAALAYRRHGDPRMEGCSRVYLAEIFHAMGDLAATQREAKAALGLLVAAPPWRPYALAVVARAELAQGDVGAARVAIEEAMRGVDSAEEGESTIRLVYADVLDACGETLAARAAIEAARDRISARAARITDADDRERFLGAISEHVRTRFRAGAKP
jgi:tetratricopeptide (TPR) repeat protein